MESEPIAPPSATTPPSTALHQRYFALLRANRNFRRLWLAQLVSELGDWFYSLAVYDLLYKTTHSGEAVGWAIIIQTLPWFLMTPLAGPIVDRFSRRRLMILTDICQGTVVLGLLMVHGRSQIWLVYLLLGIEVIFSSVFEPARAALLPDIVTEEEMLSANALASATWSLALTAGAGTGGVITALFGRNVAVVANAVSYFISAALVFRIATAETHLATASNTGDSPENAGGSKVREGLDYLGKNPRILTLVLAKTGTGITGGSILLLVIFGERIFPIAGHGALAVGLLYAVRGVGAGIGPILGDRLTRSIERRMWRLIFACFLVGAAAYFGLSWAPNLPIACLALLAGYMGGSNIWVMSTTLLQIHTSDRFRGRVFAVDFGFWMLMVAVSNYLIGVGLDHWGFTARQLAVGLGLALLVAGGIWKWAEICWGGPPQARESA